MGKAANRVRSDYSVSVMYERVDEEDAIFTFYNLTSYFFTVLERRLQVLSLVYRHFHRFVYAGF